MLLKLFDFTSNKYVVLSWSVYIGVPYTVEELPFQCIPVSIKVMEVERVQNPNWVSIYVWTTVGERVSFIPNSLKADSLTSIYVATQTFIITFSTRYTKDNWYMGKSNLQSYIYWSYINEMNKHLCL